MIFRFPPLFVVTLLVIFSCSSEESIEQDVTESLLKSYKLTRDNYGKYTIDYELEENVYLDVVQDVVSNSNEMHLFIGDTGLSKSENKGLLLEDDELNISFYENGEQSSYLSLEEGEFVLENIALESYSLTNNKDDSFTLDFKVKEGISVSYDYNEELGVYEIHLEEGVSKLTNYSKTYVKTSSVLKIDFITYSEASAKSNKAVATPGPRIIADNDF